MNDAAEDTAATPDDAVYREHARTYRSLLWSVLAVPVVFGLDLLVTGRRGALVHLPGWLLFGAVLVGVHWLLLHAVRSTHSLVLTGTELAVGDEAVPRDRIVGATVGPPASHPELATLGWPNGFPRSFQAVTLRLADGRDVLVPSRSPERLQQALRVGVPEAERPIVVREATEADLVELPSVADRADVVFRVAGHALPDLPLDEDDLRAAALVLVLADPNAEDPITGFAWVDELAGNAHLHELAVLPGSMRRGYGSRLVAAACEWAAGRGYPAMTLTTYADVPWNGPFYAARGFVVDEEPGPALREVRDAERESGLDAVGRRVVMRRALSPGTPAG